MKNVFDAEFVEEKVETFPPEQYSFVSVLGYCLAGSIMTGYGIGSLVGIILNVLGV